MPTHGYTAHLSDSLYDRTAVYRLFLQDAIPFRNHIRVGMEHGAENTFDETVSSLAYYYYKPADRAVPTDHLDVGSTTSEAAHSYTINTQTWSGSLTNTYDGNLDKVKITDDGRAHKGFSQFTMSLQATNTGAILRRRLDQGVASQKANVYVDGSLVGAWYRAGSNTLHRWCEDDFMIPGSFTRGKSAIQIKVQFVSSCIDWNEFAYDLYSLSPVKPQAMSQSASGYVNHDLVIGLTGSLGEGSSLVYRITTLPGAGSLYQFAGGARGNLINTVNATVADGGGRVVFAPGIDATGDPCDGFQFVANDGVSDSAPAQINVSMNLPAPPHWETRSFGVATGSLSLGFNGSSNATYSVWGSTNLTDWNLIGLATEASSGHYQFCDSAASNWPARFYKSKAP